MKKRFLLLLCAGVAACGGKIDGGDAGTGTGNDGGVLIVDASAKKDASPAIDSGPPTDVCTPIQGGTSGSSNGDCDTTAAWSCGDTKYTVDCSCPSTQCTCSESTGSSGGGTVVKEPNVCPGCTGDLPTICGFPH
ncbi:MAG TPA: hypothetical protein VGH28_19035 [Polyangiaceae bacterium]